MNPNVLQNGPRATPGAAGDPVFELQQLERLLSIGTLRWKPRVDRVQWSAQAALMLGMPSVDPGVSVRMLLELFHVDDRFAVEQSMQQVALDGRPFRVRARYDRTDGRNCVLEICGEAIESRGEPPQEILAALRDVTEEQPSHAIARRAACYDELTGLPNRLLLREQLSFALRRARREGTKLAVLALDLDHLRRVNVMLGEQQGNEYVKQVSNRLASCVRASDVFGGDCAGGGNGDLARSGSDEFVAVLAPIAFAEDAARVANRMLQTVAQPMTIDGHELSPSVSIGIAIHPWDGDDTDRLLRCADAALGNAKEHGRGTARFYSRRLDDFANDQQVVETGLRRALERGELLLHYQPRIDSIAGSSVGHEALLRWLHPTRGLCAPGTFIEVAERTRLIVPIGEWVLHEACRRNQSWIDAGLPRTPVAVNVSPVQFHHPGFVATVKQTLLATHLAPELLELEITESLMMNGGVDSVRRLEQLKDLGIRLAIDDFGTGYSSLTYLKDFPVDALKIDRSFVSELERSPRTASVTCAIIGLASLLDIEVVAEGVETEAQKKFLQANGCHEMQGYLFGVPCAPRDLERRWRRRLATVQPSHAAAA